MKAKKCSAIQITLYSYQEIIFLCTSWGYEYQFAKNSNSQKTVTSVASKQVSMQVENNVEYCQRANNATIRCYFIVTSLRMSRTRRYIFASLHLSEELPAEVMPSNWIEDSAPSHCTECCHTFFFSQQHTEIFFYVFDYIRQSVLRHFVRHFLRQNCCMRVDQWLCLFCYPRTIRFPLESKRKRHRFNTAPYLVSTWAMCPNKKSFDLFAFLLVLFIAMTMYNDTSSHALRLSAERTV